MKNNLLENITKLSFISLAMIPLLRENINSMLIILCVVLVLVYNIKSKNIKAFKNEYWILTTLFWVFLLHEIFSSDYNFDRVLRYLPFLIFPLLFFYKPLYIDEKLKQKSIKVFQISALLQSFIYLFIFLKSHSLDQLFYISPEGIPFFREYVFGNYFFEIHPTYFSAYLLVSFTISLFNLFIKNDKKLLFIIPNIILTIFFIFLFSSKMIFIILLITIMISIIYIIIKRSMKYRLISIIGTLIVLIALVYPSRNIIGKRFNEVRTEINKPIVGDYYNSTNTRVAIFRCSAILLKQVPFFGFGDDLQNELNSCYGSTNDSEFYKINTFNTHNYYFNLILYGGWMFLIVFIVYIVFVYKNLKYSILGLFLLLQFLLINLTENFFSRHYGVVLFTYFTSLFIFVKEKVEKQHSR